MNWKSIFVKSSDDEEEKVEKEPIGNKLVTRQPSSAKVVSFGREPSGGSVAKVYTSKAVAYQGTEGFAPTVQASGVHQANDYNQTFLDLIQGAKVTSPGYPQFFNGLKRFEGKPYTDQQKYENVFIGLEAAGATVDNIVKTAQQVRDIIASQNDHFEAEMNGFQATEIETKNDEAERLKKENEQLQAKMNENAQKAQTLEQEAFSASQQLNLEKAAFEASLNSYLGMIDSHINNLQTYLNNGTTTTV